MSSWLLTYLVHSTILLGIVAIVSRFLNSRQLPLEETLWRLAVVGGVITASAQLALAVQPLGGTLVLGATPAVTTEIASLARFTTPPPDDLRASTAAPSQAPALYSFLAKCLVLAWISGACLLTVTLIASYLRLERRLRNRRRIEGGPLMRMLVRLRQASGTKRAVRLTSTRWIAVPLAKGWWRREICLPDRVIEQLSAEQQETILAHELAHLERRDPLWLTALHLLESVLFIQPFNRLARRRLQEIAEYRCDDWAVGKTGQPVTMARCLASVAEWNLEQDHPPPTPALADRGRGLARRVARLLDRGYPLPDASRPAWLVPLASMVLLLTVLAIPGFSVAQPEAPPPPPEPVDMATPEPPSPPQPEAEPIAPTLPVSAVPAPAPVPQAPERLPTPPSPVDRRSPELQELRGSLEIERRLMLERLEIQQRELERQVAAELERLEGIELERSEALRSELEAAAKLLQSQRDVMKDLQRDLQLMAEREQALRRSELRELHEERQRLQALQRSRVQSELQEHHEEQLRMQREQLRHREELRDRHRKEMRDPEAPEDPPS